MNQKKEEPFPPPKTMPAKEFRELGLLLEINRRFLHPLGLALSVTVTAAGSEDWGFVIDLRDDPEGIYFSELEDSDAARVEAIYAELERRAPERLKALGYVIQPLGQAPSGESPSITV